jgi:hypothetical protein
MDITLNNLTIKYSALFPHLDEKSIRFCAAADAKMLGRGGIMLVSRAARLSRNTIYAGLEDLKQLVPINTIRNSGGGRKSLVEKDATLIDDLDALLEPVTRGDPMNPLRWTSKSTTKLANELRKKGHVVSQRTVWKLLDDLQYSMQSNRKSNEGVSHPDRNEQFKFVADSVNEFFELKQPVISVDAKKKEIIGEYKNNGREWCPKGSPTKVKTHDFIDPVLGKVAPYGVYDIGQNKGWVNVGISGDTAEFAVESIRRWWYAMGIVAYPKAKSLLITADGGGSNGSRVRLWKLKLQELASEIGMEIHVRHFPPGTSKWNKIEHRMFCHITENWRGQPLISREVVIQLIGNTRTAKGLEIKTVLDENEYLTGVKISDEEMQSINIIREQFHGEWNYYIKPIMRC